MVFGGLSLLAALFLWTDHRFAKTSLVAITGAATYATAVAWSWLATPVDHWVGAVIMTLSLLMTGAITALARCALERCHSPPEEADLRDRFGEDFDEYCGQIRCWIPRVAPFKG